MSDLRTRYIANLKEVALGMPVGPFRNGYVADFWRAFCEAAHLGWLLLMWLLCMWSYPVSIFVIAGLATWIDGQRERARNKARQDYIDRMNRQ